MNNVSDWVGSLSDKELTFLGICVDDETKKRRPRKKRRLSDKTISMIADLKLFSPRMVSRKHGVSRQYAYEICKRYDIPPVTRRHL